jgi:hypothetical protein
MNLFDRRKVSETVQLQKQPDQRTSRLKVIVGNNQKMIEAKNLISTLRSDHNELKRQLWILRMLDSRKDWQDHETARNREIELEVLLKKHIYDEESKLLAIFTETSGGEKLSDEAIAAEFRQNKLIIAAFKDLHDSTHSMAESRWSSIEELDRIVSVHIKEEDDRIFPLFINRIQQDESRE